MASFLDGLTPFVSWLGATSIWACVSIGMILAIQMLLKGRLPARWHYALWLVLLLQLACPWTPESRFGIRNLILPLWERVATGRPEEPAAPAQRHPAASSSRSSPTEAAGASGAEARATLARVFMFAWLAGAVVLTAIVLVRCMPLIVLVPRPRPVTDQATLELLEDCKGEMGIRTYLAVVETDRVRNPSLFGFIRPRLLLPVGGLEAIGGDGLRHVFLHELAHLKRLDIPVNWLMTVLVVLHWFNPLIWYAFHRARADREIACDAAVLSMDRAGGPAHYGGTIIRLIERFSGMAGIPALAGIAEGGKGLKKRLRMIADFRKPSRWQSALSFALVLVLGCLTLTDAQVRKGPADLCIANVLLIPSDGAYYAVASILNKGRGESSGCRLYFYLGAPDGDGKLLGEGAHFIGELQPGQAWHERTLGFGLKDGVRDIVCVLDPEGAVEESDKTNNREAVRVTVKEGKVVETKSFVPDRPAIESGRLKSPDERGEP